MDAMLLVEHIELDMMIGWGWTRNLDCGAVVVCKLPFLVSKIRPFIDLLYAYSRFILQQSYKQKGHFSNLDPNFLVNLAHTSHTRQERGCVLYTATIQTRYNYCLAN